MQAIHEKKKDDREKMTHMKEEQAQVDKALKEEFDYLVAQGAISADTPFEEFKAWRQVTWTPEGDAALQQPMPDLPDSLIFGPAGPPSLPGGPAPTGQEPYTVDPKEAAEKAAQWDCSPQDMAYLMSYWQFCMENGSAELGLTAEQFQKKFGQEASPGHPSGFNLFLRQAVGLPPVTVTVGGGKEPKKEVHEQNQGLVDAFFDNVIAKDTGFVAAEAPADAEGGAPTGNYKAPITAAELAQMQSGGNTALLDLVAEALKDPAIMDAIEAEGGGRPTREDIKAWLQGAGPNGVLAAARGLLNDVLRGIANATKDVVPASRALAAMLTLKDSYQIPGRLPKVVPSLTTIATGLGMDPRYVWDSGAQPASEADYEGYCDKVAGDDQQFFVDMFDILMTQEPYASDPVIQDIMQHIFDKEDCDTKLDGWMDFINHGDAEFDDTLVNDMIKLVNQVMVIAGAMPGLPKIAGMLLAVQEEDGSGEETTSTIAQSITWESARERAQLKSSKSALPEETATDESGGDAGGGAGGTEGGATEASTADFAENRKAANKAAEEAKEAREDAAKAVDDAHDAAAQGNRMLGGGEALEGEPGARTGSAEDFGLEQQRLQDELDSMSEMGELQQMRLQMAMDRRAKLLETLSNVMKKMSQTKETLSANQK